MAKVKNELLQEKWTDFEEDLKVFTSLDYTKA